MVRISTSPTLRNFDIAQGKEVVSNSRVSVSRIVRALSAPLDWDETCGNLPERDINRESGGTRLVSDRHYRRQLGRLGDLDPVKSGGFLNTPQKPDRSRLICPTIGPILQSTHPLHPSWNRSRTLSMTCIIGGSFFCAGRKSSANFTHPQLFEVKC